MPNPGPGHYPRRCGHAPIIANPEYAAYLRRFGEIGSKAISSAKDFELYEAVRHLSIIKEANGTPITEIESAEKHIAHLQDNMGEPSEMALIRNLHWWTVEYGLIGTLEQPKIYGAGLLSSIGESEWCMTDQVKKLPYSIEAARTLFDITKPQPQLFVTPDFAFLSQVLEDFANTMALRTGGLSGLQKLINSKELGTIELSTGLQVSGNFESLIAHDGNLFTSRPRQICFGLQGKRIGRTRVNQHETGFGSPIGRLKGINIPIEEMSPGT
ncbi:aromatic amino acid hydroxylase [Winogradskyella maritima]|nr:aromatic amino acid hydroxylase [Winogradskyella maritima]